MWVMLVFSFASTIPAGKFYPYYLYVMVLPAVVLYSISTSRFKRLAVLLVMAAMGLIALRPAIKDVTSGERIEAAYDLSEFRQLKALVGEEKVLTIRAHPAIIYFGDIVPAQPLVWTNHAEFLYGDKEDDYFLGHLEKQPVFVMTMVNLCADQAGGKFYPKSCAVLAKEYSVVMKIDHPYYWKSALVYRLKGS